MVFQGGLSFLTFSMDVIIPDITPVLYRNWVEFAHLIFRHYNPAVLSFGEAIQGDLTKCGFVYED